MTSFSIDIESILDVDSCENVLAINRWIKDSVKKAGLSCENYSFRTYFFVGELSCECDSEQEFKEYAFGQTIRINDYCLTAYISKDFPIYFVVHNKAFQKKNLYINCSDKGILAEVVAVLRKEKNAIESRLTIASNANVNVEHSNVGMCSVGDNKQIEAKANRMVKAKEKKGEKTEPSTLKVIWQTVVSNFVWVVIVAAILLFLAYLGIAKPEWLVF